jgi:predicted RND superfamily exporter protein
VLTTGFAVIAIRGSMLTTIQFGSLSALGIVVALLADLWVTPALVKLSERWAGRTAEDPRGRLVEEASGA